MCSFEKCYVEQMLLAHKYSLNEDSDKNQKIII